ncbi:hypothetical protein ACSNOK_09145 [Streptomyces sp. URMC 126]|uniref:hypothetical protein n=1 Tax=Streptomyces sp. URMC 126 TaxID=3423401 RepID=UPI003F1BEDCB
MNRAKEKGFSVDDTGRVTFTGTVKADTQQNLDHAQDEIIDITRRAILADENLSMSLMADVGVETWFNTKPGLTDINHTATLGVDRYNQLNLALSGEDPHPSRNNESPYDIGWDWLTNGGASERTYTTGDKLTELIRGSERMDSVRKEIAKGWKNGKGSGAIPFSIAKGGQGSAVKKLLTEDLPAIVTGDDARLGEAFMGSYQLHYEIKGTDHDGSPIVQYTIDNTTSTSSFLHYMGYWKWTEEVDHEGGPGRNLSQRVIWTEKIPAHGK